MSNINLSDLKITVALLVDKNNQIVDFDHVRGNRLNLVVGNSDVSFYHPESEQYRAGDLAYAQEQIDYKSEGELQLRFLVASQDGFSQIYAPQDYEKFLGKNADETTETFAQQIEEIVQVVEQKVEQVSQTIIAQTETLETTPTEKEDSFFSAELKVNSNGVKVEIDGQN